MELVWDGKYDANGRRVAPLKIALPFQTVETVNESAADRDRNLNLFAEGRESEWRNRLIWGDKKYVLPSLLPEFAGKVNLIYIDPPFDTGADFSFTTTIPDTDTSFVKEPSVIEQKAYRDTWGKGLDSYLKWFYETVVLLRDLLTDDGSIYVHLDYHVAHYAKAVLDEVFGIDNFINEIIWKRSYGHGDSRRSMGRAHDVLFLYGKNDKFTLERFYHGHSEEYLNDFFKHQDERGTYKLENLTSPHPRPNLTYDYKGYPSPKKGWRVSLDKMKELDQDDRLYFPNKLDGRIMRKVYLHELGGQPMTDMWTDVTPISAQHAERLDYPTQKPEALLERIIKASTMERNGDSDLVLDCFCGSGTTAAVAEKLGRRWITCDLGRFAIHTARKRLLAIPEVRPFVVQNLGKYERQAWQTAEFGEQAAAVTQSYREFILKLYRATPLTGGVWLHGVRGGRRVYVGGVDSAVSMGDVQNILREFRKTIGTGERAPTGNGIDVLGWDFAFELNETARQQAGLADIDLKLVRIPREVLEKKAVEQGDIKFYELAALALEVLPSGKSVTLALKDFCIPTDDVPDDIQRAITHWEQWIDYWAVDWDYRGDAFHNQDQAYRTRKDKSLKKQMSHAYAEPGDYRIVVKVIDILGNDTTKTVTVTIA